MRSSLISWVMSLPYLPLNSSSQRIPVQRNGFRYVPAKLADELTHRYVEDHWNGKVCLSLHDRSKEIDLDHLLTRTIAWGGRIGYRSIMATHGAEKPGSFYFEVLVEEAVDGVDPHVRIGLARLGANLGGPVGMDQLGFGICDTGYIVHRGIKRKAKRSFKSVDRIGCSITIHEFPADQPADLAAPEVVDFFRIYFQTKILPKTQLSSFNATIQFYVNGEASIEGPAFTQIPFGIYYPMISLYRGARVSFISDDKDMHHLPQGHQPWSELYQVKSVQFFQAPSAIADAPKETTVEVEEGLTQSNDITESLVS